MDHLILNVVMSVFLWSSWHLCMRCSVSYWLRVKLIQQTPTEAEWYPYILVKYSGVLKWIQTKVCINGSLLYILRCERVRGHFQSFLTWIGSSEIHEIQTHSLLFVPVQILLPLGRGKGGVDLCHSRPHLKNLRSRCHHYTEVASLCTCL